MALQLKVPGRSTFTEKIYPSRFMHAAELQRMGAEITIDGATAAVYGDEPLLSHLSWLQTYVPWPP
jgi:UDP-N-acetylglucosamine 1-carboxyvinyltransferase